MNALDVWLGAIAALAGVYSILWLLLALFVPAGKSGFWAPMLALVLALTVLEPFGIVAERTSQLPAGGQPVNVTSVHVARAFGVVPLLPFVVYQRKSFGPALTDSTTARSAYALGSGGRC